MCLQSSCACSMTLGGADNGADGGLSTGVDTLNSLCGRITASPTPDREEIVNAHTYTYTLINHCADHSPFRIFCVTVNVLPVSKGTIQFTGSGERIIICSGDLTRVGSGGDLTMCS